MNALLAIAIVVVLVVVAAATAMTYHALWKVWQSVPRAQRRKHIVGQVACFTVGGGLLALLIAAPWGTKDTIIYVFGGLCVVAVLCALVGAGGAAATARRQRRRRTPQ